MVALAGKFNNMTIEQIYTPIAKLPILPHNGEYLGHLSKIEHLSYGSRQYDEDVTASQKP